MLSNFERVKAAKMKRMVVLRIMCYLGAVAWEETVYDYAQQKMRLLHPLSIVWVIATFVIACFMQGIPETIKESKQAIKYDTVWW
jgi:hypothetical protein